MNFNRILRPNPNFEEDLVNHTILLPEIEKRLKKYTEEAKKRENALLCRCQRPRAGDVPVVRLNDGRDMPAFGFTTWIGVDKTPGPHAIQRAVEYAISAGYRLIDTTSNYDSEEQVGRAIRKMIEEGVVRRDEIYVVSKLWIDSHARQAVVPALRNSLSRLGLDYIDLYLVSWPISIKEDDSPDNIDPLETWAGMAECRDLRLAHSIGLAHYNTRQIDRLLALQPVKPAVLQAEISLTFQQSNLRQYCRRMQIALMACAPFGALFANKLAGSLDPDPIIRDTRLRAMATKHHKTVPQLVLRYLLEMGVVPVPRSLNRCHIAENFDIFDFTLRPEDRCLLRTLDCGFRMVTKSKWSQYPYYPFE